MLSKSQIEEVLSKAKSSGADFSELFLEDRNDMIVNFSEDRLSGLTSLHIHGAGLCVMNGCSRVYIHTNDTGHASLISLAERAAEMIEGFTTGHKPGPEGMVCLNPGVVVPDVIIPGDISIQRRHKLVKEAALAARSAGPRVLSLLVRLSEEIQNVTIANSDGLYVEDRRAFVHLRVASTVESDGESEYDFTQIGCPTDFAEFVKDADPGGFANQFVLDIKNRLCAAPVRSCVVPVIFERGTPGVLWHEMCGHNLETTHIEKGESDFAGKLGVRVASEKVTLVDDGTIPGLCGTERFDDEGNPTQKNILIEKGIVKNFLCDRIGARRYGLAPNGSGRRQNYTFAPAARMHNTFLAPGQDDEDEMINTLSEGLYVKTLGGGVEGSNFSIAVKDGYWIKNGRIDHQVKGLTLSGNSLEILKRVDRVGDRLEMDRMGGYCGSDSGLLETTSSGPRTRISAMNVAGTGKRKE